MYEVIENVFFANHYIHLLCDSVNVNSASNHIWFVMFILTISDLFETELFTKYCSVSAATAYYMSNEHPACSAKQARAEFEKYFRS